VAHVLNPFALNGVDAHLRVNPALHDGRRVEAWVAGAICEAKYRYDAADKWALEHDFPPYDHECEAFLEVFAFLAVDREPIHEVLIAIEFFFFRHYEA